MLGLKEVWNSTEHLTLDENGVPVLEFSYEEYEDSEPREMIWKYIDNKWVEQ